MFFTHSYIEFIIS